MLHLVEGFDGKDNVVLASKTFFKRFSCKKKLFLEKEQMRREVKSLMSSLFGPIIMTI